MISQNILQQNTQSIKNELVQQYIQLKSKQKVKKNPSFLMISLVLCIQFRYIHKFFRTHHLNFFYIKWYKYSYENPISEQPVVEVFRSLSLFSISKAFREWAMSTFVCRYLFPASFPVVRALVSGKRWLL